MDSPAGIRAVLFDLDGTLRFNVPSGREFFLDHAKARGWRVSGEDRARVWRWEHLYWAESAELLSDRRRFPDEPSFYMNYSRRQLIALGVEPARAAQDAPAFYDHMQENYRPAAVTLPGVPPVLAALRASGFVLGVVSNRDHPYDAELQALGIYEYFHFRVSAGEAGSKKPDPAILTYALARAGHAPQAAVYVGDNYFADVVAARRAGILPVLYDRSRIFSNPGCHVIDAPDQLLGLLGRADLWHGNVE